jgi:hypothetical protein
VANNVTKITTSETFDDFAATKQKVPWRMKARKLDIHPKLLQYFWHYYDGQLKSLPGRLMCPRIEVMIVAMSHNDEGSPERDDNDDEEYIDRTMSKVLPEGTHRRFATFYCQRFGCGKVSHFKSRYKNNLERH